MLKITTKSYIIQLKGIKPHANFEHTMLVSGWRNAMFSQHPSFALYVAVLSAESSYYVSSKLSGHTRQLVTSMSTL